MRRKSENRESSWKGLDYNFFSQGPGIVLVMCISYWFLEKSLKLPFNSKKIVFYFIWYNYQSMSQTTASPFPSFLVHSLQNPPLEVGSRPLLGGATRLRSLNSGVHQGHPLLPCSLQTVSVASGSIICLNKECENIHSCLRVT